MKLIYVRRHISPQFFTACSPRPIQKAYITLKQFPSLEEHHEEFMHLKLLSANVRKNTQKTGGRKEATGEEDNLKNKQVVESCTGGEGSLSDLIRMKMMYIIHSVSTCTPAHL